MNKVILIGNSGSDAEIKYSQAGKPVCSVSIATSEKQSDNTFKSVWHRVTLFGKLAEDYGHRIKKGSKIYVEGKLNPREWSDQAGNKRSSVDIVAFIVFIIEKEPKHDPGSYAQGQSTKKPAMTSEFTEEDIPF